MSARTISNLSSYTEPFREGLPGLLVRTAEEHIGLIFQLTPLRGFERGKTERPYLPRNAAGSGSLFEFRSECQRFLKERVSFLQLVLLRREAGQIIEEPPFHPLLKYPFLPHNNTYLLPQVSHMNRTILARFAPLLIHAILPIKPSPPSLPIPPPPYPPVASLPVRYLPLFSEGVFSMLVMRKKLEHRS